MNGTGLPKGARASPAEGMLWVAVVTGQGFPEGLERRLSFERQAALGEVWARQMEGGSKNLSRQGLQKPSSI